MGLSTKTSAAILFKQVYSSGSPGFNPRLSKVDIAVFSGMGYYIHTHVVQSMRL